MSLLISPRSSPRVRKPPGAIIIISMDGKSGPKRGMPKKVPLPRISRAVEISVRAMVKPKPIPRPLNACVVTAKVGQVPSTNTK